MAPEDISLLEGSCLKAAAVQLEPDVLHTLDSLYLFYHLQWWCYSHMYRVFKVRQVFLNGLALLVVAAGMIAGSIFENTIVVSCLAAWGSVLKGWNDFKKFPIKVDMCQFAYTMYAKTLTELRNHVRGIPWQTFDDTITDFSPPISDECTLKYHHRFWYVAVEGMCFADGCLPNRCWICHTSPWRIKKPRHHVLNDVVCCCDKKAWHTWGDKLLGYDVYHWTPNTLKKS